MIETIQCKYSCSLCGIKQRTVTVRARTTEDVAQWLDNVAIVAIGNDHSHRSPHCHPKELTELWIPMNSENCKIGAPVNFTKKII